MNTLTKENIKSLIYIIRDQKVMLDFDLARIYGYSTSKFNERVKDNIERFDEDFRFKLTTDEWNKILMSEFPTSSWGGRRKTPYAFTETGIYMLMTVLKGDLAIKQSKLLIKTFKEMKDYIIENKNLLNLTDITNLSNVVRNNSFRIDNVEKKLDVVLDNFIDYKLNKHYLILNGQKIEADIAYQNIYKSAKKEIILIDDYINLKTLQLLKSCNKNIKIIIFSDNKSKDKVVKNYVDDFISDAKNLIEIKTTNNLIHDRYIILDLNTTSEKIYHCGTSSKDAGNKITTISLIDDINIYKPIIKKLLLNKKLELK